MRSWLFACVMILITVVQRSSQVFRFCHRGAWHQLLHDDCPFGLLFNEQLQTPCFYTLKAGNESSIPRIWPTLCEDPYLNLVDNTTDATKGDAFFLAQKNGEIRMVSYDGSGDDNVKPPNFDDVISLKSCEERCYRDVFNDDEKDGSSRGSPLYTVSSHEASDSLEAPHHISRPRLSPTEAVAVTDQTLRLGDYLFDQIAKPEEFPGPKLRVVELFKRSVKILGKSCPHPFISKNFLNRVLYGFLFLVSDSGIGEIEDVAVDEFEEIMVALNACDEKQPDFRIEGTVCETSAIVKDVIKILPNGTEYTAPFLLTQRAGPGKSSGSHAREMFENPDYEDEGNGVMSSGRPFPYEELDVFTEAAWTAVQVTHATCFATFKQNANMHHRFVSAMEHLFNAKIQDRWRNPTRLIDDRMWGTWFFADVDVTFTNIQACIRASYLDAPFAMRLDRPIDPVRTPSAKKRRRKRQAAAATVQDRRDPDVYWDEYVAAGGIRYKLGDEVQCFDNPEDREAVVGILKVQCRE